jgi:hypothetical protein
MPPKNPYTDQRREQHPVKIVPIPIPKQIPGGKK